MMTLKDLKDIDIRKIDLKKIDVDKAKETAATWTRAALNPLSQWDRMRHPGAGWARIALAAALPFVLWSQSVLLVILFIAAVLAHPSFFPPFIDASPGLPLMTRLTDAVHDWLKRTDWEDRVAVLFPNIVLVPPMVMTLWNHNLFWGFYFYLAAVICKVMIAARLLHGKDPYIEKTNEDTHNA
jgi:hypothetical protein